MAVNSPEQRSVALGATMGTPPLDSSARRSPVVLTAGQQVRQYELIRELGRGGMGQVFLARDTQLGRRVAIKFLINQSQELGERFLVEARATARCNHENIVVIHEVGEHRGLPFMVLEYLEGWPLSDIVKGRTLPIGRIAELMVPVVRALARAHGDGIVHRDLKPENIFLTDAGVTKVLDFGIAKVRADAPAIGAETKRTMTSVANPMLTRAGSIMGTPAYMSPEHWGFDEVDHRSDLFAVGLMLCEMATGRHPLEPITIDHLVQVLGNLNSPLPSIRIAAPNLPQRFVELVDRCLIKRKADRLGSARELQQELESLLPGRAGRRLEEGESPYPGLTAFQEGDANRFFGRSADISRALARLRELPLLAVVGPSGVGKSSFVRAGIIPALRSAGENWEAYTLRPGRAPLSSLASLLHSFTTSSGRDLAEKAAEHHALEERLRQEPGHLGRMLRSRATQAGARVLLFVDQFEELYTLVDDPRERAAFTACLAGVSDDAAAPVRLILSMRSDLLDRVAEDPRFTDEITRGLVFLRPLDRHALAEALVHPAELSGYHFENEGLIAGMLEDLATTSGALPLLQFAASKLWETRDRSRKLITQASYDALGGVGGALASHADEVVSALPPADMKLVRAIFQRLVTPERTRAVMAVEELKGLGAGNEIPRLLDHLVAARLLVVQARSESEGSTAEIVHESLIDGWPMLRRWLEEDEEDAAFLAQLREAARQWDTRGRPQGLLWRGEALEDAKQWRRRFEDRRNLVAREHDFLRAVFDLGARAARLRRRLILGSFVFLIGLVAAAAVAIAQIREQKRHAQEQAAVARDEAARAKAAEQRVKEQLDRIQTEQAARQAAETKATEASADALMSREALQQANQDLRGALGKAQEAQRRAEKASDENRKLAADLGKKNTELDRLLKLERQRAERAEREAGKINRQLK